MLINRPINQGYDGDRGSFGRVLFCPQFNDVLDALGLALTAAEGLSITDKQSYQLAKKFYDRQAGFWSGDWVAYGSGCDQDVAQGNQLLTALNADIQAAGGSPVTQPQTGAPPGPFNFLGINFAPLIWIAGIGAGIYVLSVGYGIYKTSRKVQKAVTA